MFNKSIQLIRRLNRENFYFSNHNFQIWQLINGMEVLRNTKFQLNVSKIVPARPKKHMDMGCE